MEIDSFIANRVKDLRKSRDLTLAQLSEVSGVSRSTLSLIERQETSPTAAVLNKLADAFGISLPILFAGEIEQADPEPLSKKATQAVWTDPATGYKRRHLSPIGVDAEIELVEVVFPAGETVVFDNPLRRTHIQQQLWVIKGAMDITFNDQTWHVETGDCLFIQLGARITFHNPSAQSTRYLLALTH